MDQAEPNQGLPERQDRPARQQEPVRRPADDSAPWRLEHPVVAGYDGSSSARNALAYAAGLARRLGRPLLVVYVANAGVYCEPLTGQVVGLPRDNDALERWLLSELDAVADRGEIDVYIRTRRGSPARELAAVASDLSADALVVGAPTRFWHHLAGSVPGWLARHASCPVIVVPLSTGNRAGQVPGGQVTFWLMANIFVTGSSDGIGLETARQLISGGHRVILHARDEARAKDAAAAVPDADGVATGDLSLLAGIRAAAASANELGPYDAVIHNAGVGGHQVRRGTADGCEHIFAVNVLAPYLLTALMPLPPRLIYLTSGLESAGRVNLADLQWENRPWDGMQAYSDSKLYDVLLAFAVARRYPQVRSTAVDPGWIKTKLGGPSATDNLPEGADTQAWLAVSDDQAAAVTGRYFKRRKELQANPEAHDTRLQDALLAACAGICGATLPDTAG